MKVDPAGDAAVTQWKVLGRADGLTWLELKPLTGRTHQLRVHCTHLGAPIAGDSIYGSAIALSAARHLHLHARTVSVPVPHAAITVSQSHPHTCTPCWGVWLESVSEDASACTDGPMHPHFNPCA